VRSLNRKIEFNKEFNRAIDLLENTDKHVLITGKAGTGKSTLLDYFRSTTSKKIAVLAPTGVAAINVRGQTIHSFFNFKADVTLDSVKRVVEEVPNLYSELEVIVIDEISMVRADLLDCVDKSLRLNCKSKKPFGGKQMIFFGDLYQLPPVVTSSEKRYFKEAYTSPYFFSAKVMEKIDLEVVELLKVYRQEDEEFIEILNAIRHGEVNQQILEKLNTRFNPNFEPSTEKFYVYLTSRNDKAHEINKGHLQRLPGKLYSFEAQIFGDFDEGSYPADPVLYLKKGAQVMFLNNDPEGRWVNGSVGEVLDVDEIEKVIFVRLEEGEMVEVSPHKWNVFKYRYDRLSRSITADKVGTFIQYPLKLAWAITIHKSQGKTFENVILDLSGGIFAPGQLYVALSRCRSLEGLVLKQKIEKKHVFIDWKASGYLTSYQYQKASAKLSEEAKLELLSKAIKENKKLEIVYLKPNGKKTRRVIKPLRVGEMKYKGHNFLGVEALCHLKKEKRVFRVERILELKEAE